jgi:Electron transfer DM13
MTRFLLAIAVLVFTAACSKQNDTTSTPPVTTGGNNNGSMDTTGNGNNNNGNNGNSTGLQGMFTNGVHAVSGLAKVVTDSVSGSRTLQFENFRTDNGPDLYIYLSTDKSASGFVSLGRLKATSGNQVYEIPGNVNLTQFPNVLVWCKAFGVLFGAALLK